MLYFDKVTLSYHKKNALSSLFPQINMYYGKYPILSKDFDRNARNFFFFFLKKSEKYGIMILQNSLNFVR